MASMKDTTGLWSWVLSAFQEERVDVYTISTHITIVYVGL